MSKPVAKSALELLQSYRDIISMNESEERRTKEEPKKSKFNTCSECDGKGCEECEYSGKYAVGPNSDHYL